MECWNGGYLGGRALGLFRMIRSAIGFVCTTGPWPGSPPGASRRRAVPSPQSAMLSPRTSIRGRNRRIGFVLHNCSSVFVPSVATAQGGSGRRSSWVGRRDPDLLSVCVTRDPAVICAGERWVCSRSGVESQPWELALFRRARWRSDRS